MSTITEAIRTVKKGDRRQQEEIWRRDKINNARSAACRLRGIAAAGASGGCEWLPLELLKAAADIEALLTLVLP
jgi:hypothetical protein